MEAAVLLLTIVCYGGSIYLWWRWQTPIFLFSLIAGHIGAIASPLWPLLYNEAYIADMTVFSSLAGIKLHQPVVIGSAWFYPLPALIVLALYRLRWWFSGYVMGLFTYIAFAFYHLLIEISGLNLGIWTYTKDAILPFGIENWILSTLMAALISFALLYLLLLIFRFSWSSMLIMLLPAPLVFILIVRGLLGAPLWISLMLDAQSWAAIIGIVCTLGLLAWAVHIVALGLSRVDREIVV